MQDASEALNPEHKTVTTDEIALFKEKKKFIHAAFDKVLQNDRGKNAQESTK